MSTKAEENYVRVSTAIVAPPAATLMHTILRALLVTASLAFLAAFVWIVVHRIAWPFENEWLEGDEFHHAWRIMRSSLVSAALAGVFSQCLPAWLRRRVGTSDEGLWRKPDHHAPVSVAFNDSVAVLDWTHCACSHPGPFSPRGFRRHFYGRV